MKKNLEGRKVEFLYVYTREPHPNQRMRGYDFSDEDQTRSIKERIDYARRCLKKYKFTIPWIIDDMKGSIQKSYGGLPNSGFVIRSDGVVAFKEAWANGANLEREVLKLHPPSFYLASKKTREILLKIYDAGVRLRRSRESEARLSAAGDLAKFEHPALLPRLGAGLLDSGESVRTRVWEILQGLIEMELSFDPLGEVKAREQAAKAIADWLGGAEESHKWDKRKKRFVPIKKARKSRSSKKSSSDKKGEF